MPKSLNGIGTKYYGKRDLRDDGSYLTTNFFCLLFIPLIPLHTVRVIPDPKNSWLPFSTNYYTILERRRPNLLQVLNVYLCGAGAVAMAILYFAWFEPFLKHSGWEFSEWVEALLFAVFMTPPILIAFLLGYLATKRAQARKAALSPNAPIG